MQSEIILDVAGVAEYLRCSVEQVETLMRSGELPATKIGRSWITTYGEMLGFVIWRIETGRHRPGGIKASVATDSGSRRRLPELPDL